MSRLSIIIPLMGNVESFEAGLVTVLENRPQDCEVVVVLGCEYSDPYDLGDEVRFVPGPQGRAGLPACWQAGIEAAAGEFVHTLAPGVEVTPDWTAAALAHFADDHVAAVAPLLLTDCETQRTHSAGISYSSLLGRRTRGRGKQADKAAKLLTRVFAAPLAAGFFRRQALEAVGPLDDRLDQAADVDLAHRLQAAGYVCLFEEESRLYCGGYQEESPTGVRFGRRAGRLRWRNAPLVGWSTSLATAPFAWAGDVFTQCHRFPLAWLGRATTAVEFFSYRRHWQDLSELDDIAEMHASLLKLERPETQPADRSELRKAG